MSNLLRFIKYPVPAGQHVEGSTMTIPNLAPSLISLLESNINGQGMPLTSQPQYDESEASGFARLEAGGATVGEILDNGAAIAAEIEGLKAKPRASKAEPSKPENEPEKPE